MQKTLFFFLLALLVSCTNNVSEKLQGNWQAVKYIQQDSLIDIDLKKVQLQFDQNGHYCFSSNLTHEECGTYTTHKNILNLQDTISPNSPNKKIAIDFIDKDSLNIKMKEGEQIQYLHFTRINK